LSQAGAQATAFFLAFFSSCVAQVFLVTALHGIDLFRWNNRGRDDDDLSED